MHVLRFFTRTAGAAMILACSSTTTVTGTTGRVALDGDILCTRAKACGDAGVSASSTDNCIKAFKLLRVTPACADALNAATCEELQADHPAFEPTCFPSCSEKNTTCNGDSTITSCSASESNPTVFKLYVFDCNETCTSVLGGASTWSGTCGKTYSGQTGASDKCWCK